MRFNAAGVGLVGSLLGCAGISWLRFAIAETLRVDDVSLSTPITLALGVSFGVFATVAARCFMSLHQQAPSLQRTLGVALAVHLSAAFALPLTSNDVFSNLAYGKLAALGHNPYLEGPSALPSDDAFRSFVGRRWFDTRIVYGPVLASVCRLFGGFDSVVSAFAAWKIFVLGLTLAAVLVAYLICRRVPDSSHARRGFVLFALAPVIVWELSGQAHNDAVLTLAMVAFVGLALNGWQWAATACVSAAVWTKFAAAPALALYLLFIFRQSRARALAMAALVASIGILAVWPYWHGYATIHAPLAIVRGDPSHTARSFIDLACICAEPLGVRVRQFVFWALCLCGTGLLGLVFLRQAMRTRTVYDVFRGALVVIGVYCVFAAPWFQPWYAVWLIPLALVDRSQQWQRLVTLYAALTPIQYALPVDPITTVVINLVIARRVSTLSRAEAEYDQTLSEREYSV